MKSLMPFAFSLCGLLGLFITSSVAAAKDQYVSVDPSTLETVSGRTLMLVSYGIILGVMTGYGIFLYVRNKKTLAKIQKLQQRLNR